MKKFTTLTFIVLFFLVAVLDFVPRSTMKEMLVILIIIIGIVALYISYKRLKKRCESCGIWGAMKIVDREIIEKRKSHIVKTLKDKNSKGEVIRTREKAVPATTITYLVTEKCKHCASEEKYYKDETTEN